MSLNRRKFIRQMSALGASLPFASMLSRSAFAQSNEIPVRFVGIVNPHGTWIDYWRPRSASGGDPTETDFTFDHAPSPVAPNEKSILSPLEKWKHKLLVLDHVDYFTATHQRAQGHEWGMATALTAGLKAGRENGHRPDNISVDQYLVEQLQPNTPLDSLELGVWNQPGTGVYENLTFRRLNGAPTPQSGFINPTDVYNTLFPGGSVGGNPSNENPEVVSRLLQRKSVLDKNLSELNRLQRNAPAHARVALDAHLDGLRSLETRLVNQTSHASPVSCDSHTAPNLLNPSATAQVPQLTRAMMDLLALAFSCDRTRISTMLLFGGGHGPAMPWLGSEFNVNIHNGVAHQCSVKTWHHRDQPTQSQLDAYHHTLRRE